MLASIHILRGGILRGGLLISPRAKRYPTAKTASDGEFDPDSSRGIIVRMVGNGKRILDVGSAGGDVARRLTARGNRVTCLDDDTDAIANERGVCEEAIAADLDARSLGDVLGDRRYDVAVFDEILEQVRDPVRILRDTRSFLSDGGFAIVAISNVAHGNVRLSLLRGTFEYAPLGSHDGAHVRFFTLRSVRELCIRAGFRIDAIERTKLPLFIENEALPAVDEREFSRGVIDEIRSDREHDTLQFVLRITPVSDFDHLALALDELGSAEMRFAEATLKVERLERRIAELDGAAARSAELEAQVAILRRQLADAEAEVAALRKDGRDETLRDSLAEVNRLRAELMDASRSVGEASALRIAVDKAFEALSSERESLHAKLAAREDELARAKAVAAGAEARLIETQELQHARELELKELAEERGAALTRLAQEHSETLAAARLAELRAVDSLAAVRRELEELARANKAEAEAALGELRTLADDRSDALQSLTETLEESEAARDELARRLAEVQERAQVRERELIRIAEERSSALVQLAQEHSAALADARADAEDAEAALEGLRAELQALSHVAGASDAAPGTGPEAARGTGRKAAVAAEPAVLKQALMERDALAERLVEAQEIVLAREAANAEAAQLRETIAARELELVELQHEAVTERDALARQRAEAEAELEELRLALAARAIELMDIQRETESEGEALVLRVAEAEASVEHLWNSIAEREYELEERQRELAAERDDLAARLLEAETAIETLWETIAERELELLELLGEAANERDMLAERLAEAEDVAIAREAALAERTRAHHDAEVAATRLDAELQQARAAHRTTIDMFKGHIESDLKLVRGEMTEIDAVIRTIQRSRPWALKMLLVRVRRSLPGGRPRV
jgi:SAM-dependent methyltransferase